MPNHRLTPDNFLQIIEELLKLGERASATASLQAAEQDSIAVTMQNSSESNCSSLPAERLVSTHMLLQIIRQILSDKFPVFQGNENREEVYNQLSHSLSDFGDWPALFLAFKQNFSHIPQIALLILCGENLFQSSSTDNLNVFNDLEKQRYLELYKLIHEENCSDVDLVKEYLALDEKIAPQREARQSKLRMMNEALQKSMLSWKGQQHGIDFSSYEQVTLYESQLRLQEELPNLSGLTPREVRERLARGYSTETFCHMVVEAIKQNNTKERTETEISLSLQILEKMLQDFISLQPQALWPFQPNRNFSYDVFQNLTVSNFLLAQESPAKIWADRVIDEFEALLDKLKTVLELDSEATLTYEQRFLLYSLERSAEEYLLEQAIKKPWNPYLGQEIKKRYDHINNPINWSKNPTNDERPHDILLEIEMYPFLVHRRNYPNLTWEEVEKQMYESTLHISDEHYNRLLPMAISNVKHKINKKLTKLKQIIDDLINQRHTNGDFTSVLGLGFAGSLFTVQSFEMEVKNTIFIAFSFRARKHWHNYLLQELEYNFHRNYPPQDTGVLIKIISEQAMSRRNKRNFCIPPDPMHDKSVYQYVLNLMLETICLHPDVSVHETIRNTYISNIKLILREAKNIPFEEKNRLKRCIDNISNVALNNQDFATIAALVRGEQHYGCVEAQLSKYGRTHTFIPVTFQARHDNAVKQDNTPVYAGTTAGKQRLVIPPCHRCQLLSGPYMFWSALHGGWGLGDMNIAAENSGQPPIQPRVPHMIKI